MICRYVYVCPIQMKTVFRSYWTASRRWQMNLTCSRRSEKVGVALPAQFIYAADEVACRYCRLCRFRRVTCTSCSSFHWKYMNSTYMHKDIVLHHWPCTMPLPFEMFIGWKCLSRHWVGFPQGLGLLWKIDLEAWLLAWVYYRVLPTVVRGGRPQLPLGLLLPPLKLPYYDGHSQLSKMLEMLHVPNALWLQ